MKISVILTIHLSPKRVIIIIIIIITTKMTTATNKRIIMRLSVDLVLH